MGFLKSALPGAVVVEDILVGLSPVEFDDAVISSSNVQEAIERGEVEIFKPVKSSKKAEVLEDTKKATDNTIVDVTKTTK